MLNRWQPFVGNSSLVFAKGALATTVVTTIVWLTVTLLTKPEPDEVLLRFYRHVRPDVRGWKRVALQAPELAPHRDLGANLLAWAIGCAMIYLCLFGTGKLLLHRVRNWLVLVGWIGGLRGAAVSGRGEELRGRAGTATPSS